MYEYEVFCGGSALIEVQPDGGSGEAEGCDSYILAPERS